MSLETDNEASETGFTTISDCFIDLQSTELDGQEIIELQLQDEAPLIGFLDPLESHTFFCAHTTGTTASKGITYDLDIENLSQVDLANNKPMLNQVTRTFDSMTVDASFFTMNNEYKVDCKATNVANSEYGYISKTLNTQEFVD